MKVKYFLPWLREIGLGLLILALFLPWFSLTTPFTEYVIVRGLDFFTNGVVPIQIGYLLAFGAYLISKILPKIPRVFIFISILFTVIIINCYTFLNLSMKNGYGWRSKLSRQLGIYGSAIDFYFKIDSGFLISFLGLIALSIGIFAAAKINKV